MTLRERSTVFKALGHPARLAMVERLGENECCVGVLKEIPELANLGAATVSQHLLVLKSAGIIADERRGRRVYYCLIMPCVTGISLCVSDRSAVTQS